VKDRLGRAVLWNTPIENEFTTAMLRMKTMPFGELKSGFTEARDKFNSLIEEGKKFTQMEGR